MFENNDKEKITKEINSLVDDIEKIKENDGYCPCQLEKNENKKFICKNFLNQVESGWCHCRLYYKDI